MTRSFTFIALLAVQLLSAQLTITKSSFIYSDAKVIYVEDDLNLNDPESKLYLRNDAQLVQGSGTSGNSGLGELSVQQNGTVNEYAYNFWCSPVGNIDANDNTNRGFRANLFDESTGVISSIDAQFTSGNNGFSSPLTISSRWIYTYQFGTSVIDWNYVGASGNISPGLGFTMKGTSGSDENQLYEFRGKPNNGTITNIVADGQFTLIGNPYPSAIDAFDFIHDPENVTAITGDLHYWEQAPNASSHNLADYLGGYATYTISSPGEIESFVPATFTSFLADGSATNFIAGNGDRVARRYIPIGQGFMVEGISEGVVTVKNSHREFYKESDPDSFFFRNASSSDTANNLPEDFKRFRINIDFDQVYTRQLLMNFHNTATDGFDYGLEGKSPGVLNSDAYWTQDDIPFVIQAFSYDDSLNIPLIVKVENQQIITFNIGDVQNFDDSQSIYLHDIETANYIDLRTQDYSVNLSSGTYSDRFEIVFITPETLSVEIPLPDESMSISQYNNRAQAVINNPQLLDITAVRIVDMNGRIVNQITEQLNDSEVTINTSAFTSGVYIIHVTTRDREFSKKVIISN